MTTPKSYVVCTVEEFEKAQAVARSGDYILAMYIMFPGSPEQKEGVAYCFYGCLLEGDTLPVITFDTDVETDG